MSQDTLQIGPWLISKAVFDTLIALIGPLLGVFIGGFMTYLSTSAIETRKWKRERESKLLEQKREALIHVLNWLVPIDAVLIHADGLVSRFRQRLVEESDYFKEYRKILDRLHTIKDPPVHMQVLLPKDCYPRVNEILRMIQELQHIGLEQNFDKELYAIRLLHSRKEEFKAVLEKEYLKTYE